MQRHEASNRPFAPSVARVRAQNWTQLTDQLDAQGYTSLPGLIDTEICRELIALYAQPALFRSKVVMERHGYGRGEYQYFARPLPELVQQLRQELYAPLAPLANRWMERLRRDTRFASELEGLEHSCAELGQTQPTPLMLKYTAGDENRLHQDMYGELHFPLQVVVLLSEPGREFSGGEFVLTEQRPRMQSRVEVIPMQRGDAVIFTGAVRPVTGTRGDYAVKVRHGVSRVRHGERYTLGVIFHNAE
ncbi:MAG TPA: 2OG-Fe(II) oxygenase [Polyangiales bacterium]|nr:2OG-Fe(II) oxygenase [Polyangiales bacterium]